MEDSTESPLMLRSLSTCPDDNVNPSLAKPLCSSARSTFVSLNGRREDAMAASALPLPACRRRCMVLLMSVISAGIARIPSFGNLRILPLSSKGLPGLDSRTLSGFIILPAASRPARSVPPYYECLSGKQMHFCSSIR